MECSSDCFSFTWYFMHLTLTLSIPFLFSVLNCNPCHCYQHSLLSLPAMYWLHWHVLQNTHFDMLAQIRITLSMQSLLPFSREGKGSMVPFWFLTVKNINNPVPHMDNGYRCRIINWYMYFGDIYRQNIVNIFDAIRSWICPKLC